MDAGSVTVVDVNIVAGVGGADALVLAVASLVVLVVALVVLLVVVAVGAGVALAVAVAVWVRFWPLADAIGVFWWRVA